MRCHFCKKNRFECFEQDLSASINCVCVDCHKRYINPIRKFLRESKYMMLIKTNYELKLIDISNEKFNIRKIQELIGGYIEIFSYKNEKYFVLVNEDGINLRLEINNLAKDIFDIYAFGNIVIIPKDYINWKERYEI